MMQFQSQTLETTTTMFIASTPSLLKEGMQQLMESQYWDSLNGDLTLLTIGKPEITSERIGPTYYEGNIGKTEYFGYLASKYPWVLYGVTVIVLALLALLCLRALRRQLHRRTHAQDV